MKRVLVILFCYTVVAVVLFTAVSIHSLGMIAFGLYIAAITFLFLILIGAIVQNENHKQRK